MVKNYIVVDIVYNKVNSTKEMIMSMRLVQTTFFSVLLLLVSIPASAFNGIPDKLSVGGKQVVLNGAGTRTKFIISVYNMGLYLQKKSNNAQQIISANEAMAIRIQVVSGFASAAKISQAFKTGFHNATGGKTAPIQPQINQFLKSAFGTSVKKGDIFDFAYTPAGGVKVSKNNKGLTVVKGLPFKQALVGIWLSNKPAQGSLKNQLLGK